MTSPSKAPKSKVAKPQPITATMLMGDIVTRYPQSTEILTRYGFHCIGCMLSPYESLEAGAAVHGIPIEPLLKELNEAAAS